MGRRHPGGRVPVIDEIRRWWRECDKVAWIIAAVCILIVVPLITFATLW